MENKKIHVWEDDEMNRKKVKFIVSLCCALSLLFVISQASARVAIFTNDGNVHTLPINKADIISIHFDDSPGQVSQTTWDFETGELGGWTKTGTAFDTQPTYGDNPTARNRGQASNHQGNYWIGGYENRHRESDPPGRVQGDGPQGTLTSAPFSISSSAITFLIGGGCDINTERVELLINGQVVLKATGKCTETMEPLRWDVSPYQGRKAQIRLIDKSGGGWGHINFDDVHFE
jgi:hypothetical protein